MDVTGFHHVSVNTNGAALETVVEFYREVLGLADAVRPDIRGVAGHWCSVGDLQLHIVDVPSPSRPPSGIDPTGPHYCIAVADLDEAIAELEGRGINYLRAVQSVDVVQIWLIDPAGNTIELQQETEHR